MKSRTDYHWFNTAKHREYVNITDLVAESVRKSGVREGMALVSAMHITAGVFVNDDEPGILHDIDEWAERLAPFLPPISRANDRAAEALMGTAEQAAVPRDYNHHHTGETNGDSHLKSLLVHHQVILPITDGKLDLGPWQQVFYAEFDGQRRKRLIIKVIGE